MPEEKFTPPPSKIVIRTMEKDLQALQQGGGELPQQDFIEEPIAPPLEEGFLQQETFSEATPADGELMPTMPPPPPVIPAAVPAPQAASFPPTAEPTVKKSGSPSGLLLALGGTAGILALAALGYFVAWPLIRDAYQPAPPPLVAEPTPTPEPPAMPPAPAITLAVPADAVIEINLPIVTASRLVAEIQRVAGTTASPNTFKEIEIRSGNRWLSSEEIFSLLFNNAPGAMTGALANTYSLFLFWRGANIAHFGAYFSLNPIAAEAASAAALAWEARFPADASAFFLGTAPPGGIAVNFRDDVYQNIAFRFTALGRDLAISHGIVANTFVYTTHRDAMTEALRRLTAIE